MISETVFATDIVDNETGVTKPVAEIFDGLAPISGMRVERLIEGISLATDQQPAGTGIANALDVEFGTAIGDINDPVMLDANGVVTFNDTGLYRIKVVLQFGRTGGAGTSELYFRFLVGGIQLGRTVSAKLQNANTLSYIDIDNWFNVPEGTTLQVQVMRDDGGNNSGGLFQITPTDEGAGTWNVVPSAVMRVERFITI